MIVAVVALHKVVFRTESQAVRTFSEGGFAGHSQGRAMN